MKKTIFLPLIVWLLLFTFDSYAFNLTTANPLELSTLIQQHSLFSYLALFFVLGILLAFTPCVLPMVPILASILSRQHPNNNSKAQHVKLAFFYVLGMAVSYAIAGMLAGAFGQSLQTFLQKPVVILSVSLFMLVMSFSLFGLFELKLPQGLQTKWQHKHLQKGSIVGVFFTGALATLIVSPCVTAPLIGVLTFISQTGQVSTGGLILFVLALGMGVPLILFAVGQGALLPKTGPWMARVKLLFAYLMVLMSVWLASRVLTANLSHGLYALVIATAVFHLSVKSLKINTPHTRVLCSFLLAFLASSVFFMGSHNQSGIEQKVLFEKASTLLQLESLLANAKQQQQAVFLEFYATWCSDCTDMDEKVFNQQEVIQRLAGIKTIHVDISNDTPTTKAFKKAYQVYGTPTLLFYNKKGVLLKKLNTAGFVTKSHFLPLVNALKRA